MSDQTKQQQESVTGQEPEINQELLPLQKAFVLMQLFCAQDGTESLTKSDLHKKLASAAATRALLFARLSSDPVVNPDQSIMNWVIQQLVQSEDVQEKRRGRYILTERGRELLVATDQHPSLEFRLKGKQLNALREAIRDSSPGASTKQEPRVEPELAPLVEAPPLQPALTAEGVLKAFEDLRRERFARNGIVPVFELRRQIIDIYGPEAGSHKILDELLKQMRREKQLRMIAIGDLSEATPDQLNDSVPGDNETFFYLETAHEYAHV